MRQNFSFFGRNIPQKEVGRIFMNLWKFWYDIFCGFPNQYLKRVEGGGGNFSIIDWNFGFFFVASTNQSVENNTEGWHWPPTRRMETTRSTFQSIRVQPRDTERKTGYYPLSPVLPTCLPLFCWTSSITCQVNRPFKTLIFLPRVPG